jgi:hypothetical protein
MGRDELKHLSKNDLVRLVPALQEEVRELRATLSRLTRDSSNSSKPPSSDIVKPPRPQPPGGRQQRRRIGGQPGHERHERAPFPPEEVEYEITCEHRGGNWAWDPRHCRAARVSGEIPTHAGFWLGFRLVSPLKAQTARGT